MFSSRIEKSDIVFEIYKDSRTVFRLKDIAMLVGNTNFNSLNKKINYYVQTGKLMNLRKGIYAKPGYNPEELSSSVYRPSYISLEYVLQKAGIIFQFDNRITVVSYLCRNVVIDNTELSFRKVKPEIIYNLNGIIRQDNHVNIASAERAFLDLLYLKKDYYFDNLNPLNKDILIKLLPIYNSKSLQNELSKLLGI
jgi:hypothetical protein